MDFNAVYHRANDNYCYPLDKDQLIINIRTEIGRASCRERV